MHYIRGKLSAQWLKPWFPDDAPAAFSSGDGIRTAWTWWTLEGEVDASVQTAVAMFVQKIPCKDCPQHCTTLIRCCASVADAGTASDQRRALNSQPMMPGATASLADSPEIKSPLPSIGPLIGQCFTVSRELWPCCKSSTPSYLPQNHLATFRSFPVSYIHLYLTVKIHK